MTSQKAISLHRDNAGALYCIVFFNAETTGKVTGEQNKIDQITSQSLTLCLKKTAKKNRDGRNQKDKILASRRSTQIYRYSDLHSRHKSRGNTENYYTISADGTLSKSLPLRVRHLNTENAQTEKIASTCYVLLYLALCAFFFFLTRCQTKRLLVVIIHTPKTPCENLLLSHP